jgi:outer membrane protein TolC
MDQLVSSLNTTPMKRAIAVAIVWCSLLVLPSCIPPLRNPKQGPGLPESFNLRKADPQFDLPDVFDHADSPENSAQVKIEEFYNDPMLTGMMHRALVGNQELRILSEDVQIASNEILARQGAYLPFVSPAAGSGIEKFGSFTLPGAGIRDDPFRPGQFFPNPLPNYLLGFTFLWTPDIWYQLHNARDAAAMRYYATAEGRNFFVTRLIAEIAENYYRLMALDARLENLNRIIALQERSYEIAKARKEAARSTDLPVLRFLAEVRRNQSEKLIVYQDIVEAENRLNFSLGRNPQRVERKSGNINDLIDLRLHSLSMGVPAELLRNRPDIRQAERELAATGLDVLVARKRFYPQGLITSGVGYQAFNPTYLFITPESIAANVAGNLLVPLINRKAIKADYFTANARQLQAVYNYQRVVLTAFTELVNRLAKVENYRNSIEIKKQQVQSLEEAVAAATSLYNLPRAELPIDYLDVLTAQNELFAAIRDLINTKGEQLSAIVNTYQALGGGSYLFPIPVPKPMQPYHHYWPHLWHSHASAAAGRGPGPVPAPPGGPPKPPPTAAEEASPELLQEPPGGPPKPPPTAAEEKGPGPAPTPAAETSLEPLPTPMGGGNGSGTGSNTKDAPR